MGDLGQAERLEERWQVDAEATAETLLQAVPATEGVRLGAAPGLDSPFGCRLLLVGAPERHPVALRQEPGVQVTDRPGVVQEPGAADLADDGRRIRRLVPVHRVLGGPWWSLQNPGVFLRASAGRHVFLLARP